MHETLQAINNHKYSNVLENIGDSDITYNINFNLFKKFIEQFDDLNSIISNQKKFLTSMGILQRAEIISKNIPFSKKTDLFYRIRRLIDEKQMGELFKVMLIKKQKINLKQAFKLIKSKKLSKIKNLKHGFFNSVGGKSKNIYKSLNCGPGSKDNKSNVKKNLEIVRKKISNKAKNIFLLHQIHSNKFIYIDEKYKNKKKPKADAIITNQKICLLLF